MSPYKPKAMYAASERQYTAAVGEVQVPGGGSLFTGDGRWSEKMHGLVKLTQFCASCIALWSQNGSFQTPQSSHCLIGLCSDPYLWSSYLGDDRKNINSGGSVRDGIFAKSSLCDTVACRG